MDWLELAKSSKICNNLLITRVLLALINSKYAEIAKILLECLDFFGFILFLSRKSRISFFFA
jgi:hypothetical protein